MALSIISGLGRISQGKENPGRRTSYGGGGKQGAEPVVLCEENAVVILLILRLELSMA